MRALTAPLEELGELEELKKQLKKEHTCVSLTGCVESQKLHMIYGVGEGFQNKLIVTFSDLRVKELMEDYRFYDRNVMAYPSKDLIFYQADIHGNQLVKERIKCLREDGDFTQEQIGKLLNKSQQGYNHIEAGRAELKIDDLAALCRFYNVSADYIIGLCDTAKPLI